jgi:hypothetical protein
MGHCGGCWIISVGFEFEGLGFGHQIRAYIQDDFGVGVCLKQRVDIIHSSSSS